MTRGSYTVAGWRNGEDERLMAGIRGNHRKGFIICIYHDKVAGRGLVTCYLYVDDVPEVEDPLGDESKEGKHNTGQGQQHKYHQLQVTYR